MRPTVALATLLVLAACANAEQTAATQKAVLDGATCLVTVAPSVAQVVATKGISDAQKGLTAGTVAVTATTTAKPCTDALADGAAAVAAGKQAVVTPAVVPPPAPAK